MMKTIFLHAPEDRLFANYLIKKIRNFKIPKSYHEQCQARKERLQHIQCVPLNAQDALSTAEEAEGCVIVLCSEQLKPLYPAANQYLTSFYEKNKERNLNRIVPIINLAQNNRLKDKKGTTDVKAYLPEFMHGDKSSGRDEILGACLQKQGERRVVSDVAAKILEIEIPHPPIPPGVKKVLWTGGTVAGLTAAACMWFSSLQIPLIPGVLLLARGIIPSAYAKEIVTAGTQQNEERLEMLTSATTNRTDILTQAFYLALNNDNADVAAQIRNRLIPICKKELQAPGMTEEKLNSTWSRYITEGNLRDALRFFLAGLDINRPLQEGKTALHLAMKANKPTLAKHLLTLGANLSQTDNEHKLPVDYATGECKQLAQSTAARQLAAMGITPENYQEEILLHCYHDDADFIALMITAGMSMQYDTEEYPHPLLTTIEGNNSRVFHLILHHEVPRKILDKAVWMTAGKGQSEYLRSLLKRGANPNATSEDGVPALMAATAQARADCVTILLESGANPNVRHPATQDSVLHTAITNNMGDIVQKLLQHEADPNEEHPIHGFTPILLVTDGSYYEKQTQQIAEALMKAGATPDKSTSVSGLTPFETACITGNLAAVTAMLPYVKDLHKKGKLGLTAVEWAICNECQEVVEFLMEKGARIGTNTDEWSIDKQLQIGTVALDTCLRELNITSSQSIQLKEVIGERSRQYEKMFRPIGRKAYLRKKAKAEAASQPKSNK